MNEKETTCDAKPDRGPDVIRAFVKTLPGKPGVYRMLDENGEVLYVGKARNLKNRVSSYTRYSGHSVRIATMISATVSMEFIITASEAEALLLEANLIKKFRPPYNVVLRDDKSFPYILIARDHEVAQLVKHRGSRSRKGRYYGPFASAGAVNRTINALQKAFFLRSCTDSVFENRTRPCLLFQIKRCAGPCTGEISLEDYNELVRDAQDFLSGKTSRIKTDLARAMEEAADRLDYERAAVYRDRIKALSHVSASQDINPRGISEADVFASYSQAGQTCIQVFFFRAGQNWGNRAYFPRADKSYDEAEVMSAFVSQFYDNRPVPRQLLLSLDIPDRQLLEEAFSSRSERRVRIDVPKRGAKRELIAYASNNAREALGRKLAATSSQARLLDGAARVFELEQRPQRIEVYDNSHIQGSHAVGAMIVAGKDGFIKNQYRKFNIRLGSQPAGDDYAMMREVLERRFSRLVRESEDDRGNEAGRTGGDVPDWPDLVIVDGGAGQLSVALEVLGELGLGDIKVAGIAKGPDRNAGREHIYLPGKAPFMLEARDPVLYYIQRLRDEAHRFAIGSHRARRTKAISANPLDEISGIGPRRKKALLRAFGSAREVSVSRIDELEKVEGISRSMARVIWEHFNG